MAENPQDVSLKQKDMPVFTEANSRFFKKSRDVPLLRAGKGTFEPSTPQANALKFPFSTPQRYLLLRGQRQLPQRETPGSKEG